MQDVNGGEQMAIGLNGESQSLEFSFTTLDHERRTVVFSSLSFVFNSQWHKVLLRVNKQSVSLFLDCVLIDIQEIPVREKVSLDGFTLIGKLKENPVLAVPVSLFTCWMYRRVFKAEGMYGLWRRCRQTSVVKALTIKQKENVWKLRYANTQAYPLKKKSFC